MWFLNDHDIKCKYLPITLLRIKNISSEYTVAPPHPQTPPPQKKKKKKKSFTKFLQSLQKILALKQQPKILSTLHIASFDLQSHKLLSSPPHQLKAYPDHMKL